MVGRRFEELLYFRGSVASGVELSVNCPKGLGKFRNVRPCSGGGEPVTVRKKMVMQTIWKSVRDEEGPYCISLAKRIQHGGGWGGIFHIEELRFTKKRFCGFQEII